MKALIPSLLTLFLFSNAITNAQEETSPEIFTIVENMPEFIGGDDVMMDYIGKNLKYPAAAKDAEIQGLVYVTFVVVETGKVTDVKVLRGIGGGCDEAAVEMVSNMPYWSPGTQRGQKVKVQYNLPIRFVLEQKKKRGFFNWRR